MIQPHELKLELPMKLSNSAVSTTTKVWAILSASRRGDLESVKQLVNECPELAYAQYNYAPPIQFAVREGHVELVRLLLDLGAHDPSYKFYPFQESLQTVAADRGYSEIVEMLTVMRRNLPGKGHSGAITDRSFMTAASLNSSFNRLSMEKTSNAPRRS